MKNENDILDISEETINEVLRYVAASDAAGRLMLSASQVEEAALTGSTIRNQVDLNRFIEETNKSLEKRAALGKELGIQENEWDTLQLGRFNEAIRAYRESGKADAYKHKIEIIEKAKAIPEGDAKKKMPNALTLGDGMIRRYKTEKADIAIARDGSTYMLYDYNSGDTSRSLTRAEANTLLHELKAAGEVNIPTDVANTPENAENSALKNQNQGNMGVTSENSFKTSEKTSEISLSPNARRAVAITEDGKVYVQASRKVINGTTKAEQRKEISNFFSRLLDGGKSLDIHTLEGDVLTITKKDTARKARDDYKTEKGKPVRMTDEEFSVKMRIESHIDEVAEISKKKKGGQEDSKTHDFAKAGFTYRKAYFEDFDGQYYEVTLSIGHNGTVATVYNVGKIKESVSPSAKVIAVVESKAPWETLSKDSIPNSGEKVNTSEQKTSEKSTKERIAEVRERLDAKKIDKYLTENVEEYSSFGEQNKSMIRKVVREGIANGLDDADILSYARVAARTGINVEFDTAMKDGEAGYFDPDKNRIVINPKTTKKHELLLIHELDHAIRAYIGNDGKIHYLAYKDADKKVSAKTRKHIKEHYADQEIDVSREELFADESSAYYSEAILGGDKFIDLLLGKEPTLQQKILSFFTGAAQSYSKDPELAKAARAHYRSFKKMFADFAERNKGRNAETAVEHGATTEKSVRSGKDIAREISVGMSDDERAKILRSKSIDPVEIKQVKYADLDWIALEKNKKSAVEKSLIQKLRALGHLKAYKTESIDIEFEFTGGGVRKSLNSQVSDYGGTLADFAKVVLNMQALLDSSVLIEIHKDKAFGTKKENARLVQTYVLMSAFAEDKFITPVQFEIKQYIDNENRLYLAVALTKIETGVLDDTALNKEERTRLIPISKYSIPQFVQKINPKDENFFKYIPDEFLTEEQKAAKQRAIEKEKKKYARRSTDFEATLADDHAIESVAGRDAKAGAKRASRFSKRATDMTVGQLRQMVARYTGEKVYSSSLIVHPTSPRIKTP